MFEWLGDNIVSLCIFLPFGELNRLLLTRDWPLLLSSSAAHKFSVFMAVT